jgi:dihydrofolate reductase
MIGHHSIEGYAIVSADGMIADRDGAMPDSIRNDADQHFLQSELDRAALVLHGRHSHEGGPKSLGRRRLVLTHAVAALAPDPEAPLTLRWNPAGVTLEAALAALKAPDGPIAVIGGTAVFGMFLPFYDAFHLTRATRALIPGGRPVFPQVSADNTPEQVLAAHGLRPEATRVIDESGGITVTTWRR